MSTGMKQLKLIEAKKKQEEADAIAKNPCKRCSMLGRKICGCGGGGGGGSSGDEATESGKDNDNKEEHDVPSDLKTAIDLKESFSLENGGGSGPLKTSPELKPDTIKELLEKLKDLLTIHKDDEEGILTILSVRAFSSPQADLINKYVQLIRDEFADFKDELRREGQNLDGYTETLTENSLIIRIPSLQNYDRFIARLAAKHLLDLRGKNAKEESSTEPHTGQHRLSPLPMEPYPSKSS